MTLNDHIAVASLVLGKGPGMVVYIHGHPAAVLGVPLVEIAGPGREHLQHLTIKQAEELAAGLLLAARVARGEVLPTMLDRLLGKRKA